MSYPNITDRISYLEQKHIQDMSNMDTNKADKTDLNNYLPLSGGTLHGNLNIQNMYCCRGDLNTSTTWSISNSWDNGPSISLYGHGVDEASGLKGAFIIRAMNADTSGCQLIGKPNSGLFWNNQDIPTSYWVGGNNCTALVYSNGWVEQWGYYPQQLSASSTVTTYSQSFAYPFISEYYCLIVQPTFMGSDWGAEKYQVCGKTSTYFTLALYNWRNVSQAWYCWYACGTWK